MNMLCEVGVCGMVSLIFILFGFAAYWQAVPAVLWVMAGTAQGEEQVLPAEVMSVRPSMRLVIWFSLLETL